MKTNNIITAIIFSLMKTSSAEINNLFIVFFLQ